MINRVVLLLILGFLSLQPSAGVAASEVNQPQRPTKPIPAVEHVMIISIDGLRPDRALLAEMPNLRSLIRGGSYSFWAKTTPASITLPSHTSMITGVNPQKHGIEWNSDLPFSEPVYPRVPTALEYATRAGYVTALVAGKSKFNALNKPGTITHVAVADGVKGDNASVTAATVEILRTAHPDFSFIHYPDVDGAGHAYGWGSAEQYAMIESTDKELGKILAVLEELKLRSSTFIIVTADHGGAGKGHGPDDPRSRHIPWIANGPSVRPGFDLTQIASLEVRTEDSAATAMYLLGLPLPPYLDGKPVLAAFLANP